MDNKPTYEELVKKLQQMEKEIESKNLRVYKKIVSTTSDHLSLLDENYTYQIINESYVKAHGLPYESIVGKSVPELLGRETFENLVKEKLDRCLQGEEVHYDSWFDFPGLGSRFMSVTYSPYKPDNGTISGIVVSSRDITERKRIEETHVFLSQCGHQYPDENFFESLARYLAKSLGMDFVCIDRLEGDGLTAQTVAVYHNGTFEDNISYSLKDTPCRDVVDKSVCCFPANVCELFPRDAVLKDLRAESHVGVTLLSSAGQPIGRIAVIGRQPLADKHLAESILKIVAVRAAGELERTQAEKDLLESESRYRELFETSRDGIAITDLSGHYLECNQAYLDLLGYETIDELWMKSYEELTPKEYHALETDIIFKQTMTRGWCDEFEKEYICKTGERVAVSLLAWLRRNAAGQPSGMWVIVRDITERKQAEEELKAALGRITEEKDKTEAILAALGEAVSIQDRDFKVLYQNQVHRDLIGTHQGEYCYQAYEKRETVCEGCPINKSFVDGGVHTAERRTDADSRIIHVEITASPLRNAHGEIIAGIEIVKDVAERRKFEHEVQKAQKLESIGILAGGIAHDFNNILTAIMGNISLAKLNDKPGNTSFECLAQAEKAAIQAAKLTQQLLTFAKGGAPVFKTTSITAILKDASGFVLHGSNVKCKHSLPEDLWPVAIDSGQISQVFQNLVINANQAMPKGGIIRIEAGNEFVDTANHYNLRQGKYVKVAVVDQGEGIPQAHLDKIFDPFFSTKPTGSGLGLSTCHSIVKRHGGAITVDSILNIGTTFQVYLPVSEKESLDDELTADALYTGSGRILVMDDDPGVRSSLTTMLKNIGYEVEVSQDGMDALKQYRQALENKRPFAAVILDLTIPGGMGGVETLERLRELVPDLKAIVSSGYSDDPALANYKKYGFAGAMSKPYQIHLLGKVLHDVLTS